MASSGVFDTEALAEALCHTGRLFADRGLCPGTGGNFSVRIEASHVLITASGVNKRRVTPADLLRVDLDGHLETTGQPSAETALHLALYRADAAIGAVLHTHSVANTLISRINTTGAILFEGYEMQKAITGHTSHEATLSLPVVDNSQDMPALANVVSARYREAASACGFLVRGHGIYAWGRDVAEAERHLEGWEFLLECELKRRLLEVRP